MPSKIEWTDETWNPITGCTPVSEGCEHCYAKRMATWLRGRFGYPQDDPFRVTFHPDKLDEPLHWKKPRMVFPCSMGDLFHDDVPFPVIQRIWATMQHPDNHKHTFQVLTKRPNRVLEYYKWNESQPRNGGMAVEFQRPHIWLGVTAENQARADERIPILLQIPAAVRFVSVEPMLGPVDIERLLICEACRGTGYYGDLKAGIKGNREYQPCDYNHNFLNWVICGGETGPGARPMHLDWARDLRNQCHDAGVPFFFKQWGEYAPISSMHMLTRNPYKYRTVMEDGSEHITGFQPEQGTVNGRCMNAYKVNKKRAGRMLDGRTWDGMPGKINTESTEDTEEIN